MFTGIAHLVAIKKYRNQGNRPAGFGEVLVSWEVQNLANQGAFVGY